MYIKYILFLVGCCYPSKRQQISFKVLWEQLMLFITRKSKRHEMWNSVHRNKVKGNFQTLPCVTFENFMHPSSFMAYFYNVKYISSPKKRDRSVIHVQIVVRHILSFLVDDQKGNKFQCAIENVQGYPTNHQCTKGLV